jgi:hypothetical protein
MTVFSQPRRDVPRRIWESACTSLQLAHRKLGNNVFINDDFNAEPTQSNGMEATQASVTRASRSSLSSASSEAIQPESGTDRSSGTQILDIYQLTKRFLE